MARNEEKNLTILNRIYLKKQQEYEEELHPKRPLLHTLKTGAEVRQWIGSIKKELNYCLQQTSGIRNYPDHKILQFQERVEELKREHKRWVKRALQLDPTFALIGEPGEPHAYCSKRKLAAAVLGKQQQSKKEYVADANDDDDDDEHPPTKQLKIATPLVDQEDEDAQEQKQHDHTQERTTTTSSSSGSSSVLPLPVVMLHTQYKPLDFEYKRDSPPQDKTEEEMAADDGDGDVEEEEEEPSGLHLLTGYDSD